MKEKRHLMMRMISAERRVGFVPSSASAAAEMSNGRRNRIIISSTRSVLIVGVNHLEVLFVVFVDDGSLLLLSSLDLHGFRRGRRLLLMQLVEGGERG